MKNIKSPKITIFGNADGSAYFSMAGRPYNEILFKNAIACPTEETMSAMNNAIMATLQEWSNLAFQSGRESVKLELKSVIGV